MGGGSYSDRIYSARMATHKSAGTDPFSHTASVASGATAAATHESLDPKKPNSFGKIIRESFDNDEHPESRAIAVLFDVTGSMRDVPRIFLDNMPKLMAGLLKKGYVKDPQILFGAIGDATCDDAPLQLGQFESSNVMDSCLTNIYLEGNGGGQNTESYELAMYYMARNTDMHCFTKRNQKGYLFLSGDEKPYSHVKKAEVERIIGQKIQENIPTEEILNELRQKFEVFWIMPKGASNFTNTDIIDHLKALFGQNYLSLPNPADICELIISTIGLMEGYSIKDISIDLRDIGSDDDTIARVTTGLVPFSKRAVGAVATASAALEPVGADSVERL